MTASSWRGCNNTPAKLWIVTRTITNTSAVIRVKPREGISHVRVSVTHDPLSVAAHTQKHQCARAHTHAQTCDSHTGFAYRHVEPVSGQWAWAALKLDVEALNGWSVYREKKGVLSGCQIWNTFMLMRLPLSDETADLFDVQQMIHGIWTKTQTGRSVKCA